MVQIVYKVAISFLDVDLQHSMSMLTFGECGCATMMSEKSSQELQERYRSGATDID